MAQPIEIPIQATGIAAVKAELRALKGELVNATDPAVVERLSQAAGKLSDKIADANEKIKIFAAGSEFEKVSNGLGLIGSQLSNMDFEGAAESAKLLTNTIKNMNPKEVIAGFKSFITVVGQLSNAFVQMGIKLLANPLFLLVAVIVAIVAIIILLKDKIKIIEQAFDLLMIPIKALIQLFKDLTDAIGLTNNAEEDAAEKSLAATNKRIAANQKLTESMDKEYSRQIALAKANGQDTEKLEIQSQQFKQNMSFKNVERLNKEIKIQSDLLKSQTRAQQEETRKKIDDLVKERDENVQINKDSANQVAVIKATSNTKDREETAKHNKELQEKAKKHSAELLKIEKQRIEEMRAFQKLLRDAEIQDNVDRTIERMTTATTLKEIDIQTVFDALQTQQEGLEKLWANTEVDRETRLASLESFNEQVKNDDSLTEEERTQLLKENSEARMKIDEEALAAKQKMMSALSQTFKNAAILLGESTAAGKAMAIAGATIDTYQSSISAYKGMVAAIPGPVGIAAGAIAAASSIATGIATVKKILAVKVPGGKDAGGTAPSAGGTSAPAIPSVNLIGNANQGNNATSAGTVDAKTGETIIKAVVSETEITSVQNKVAKMKANAEL